MLRILTLSTLSLLVLLAGTQLRAQPPLTIRSGADKDKPAKEKRHGEGPLSRSDFVGKPDATSRNLAYTRTDIRFTYRHKYTRLGANYLARLEEVKVYSVFIPEESWIKPGAPTSLIDHEQGHFDLTEIYARKTQQRVDARLRSYSATALSRSAAEEKLKTRLKREIAEVFKECIAAQKKYDYQTRHGTRADAQRLHRREHGAELAKSKRR